MHVFLQALDRYGSIYSSPKPHGLGGGQPILDGRYHEMASILVAKGRAAACYLMYGLVVLCFLGSEKIRTDALSNMPLRIPKAVKYETELFKTEENIRK